MTVSFSSISHLPYKEILFEEEVSHGDKVTKFVEILPGRRLIGWLPTVNYTGARGVAN